MLTACLPRSMLVLQFVSRNQKQQENIYIQDKINKFLLCFLFVCLFLYFLYILKSSASFVSDPSPCSKFPDQIKEQQSSEHFKYYPCILRHHCQINKYHPNTPMSAHTCNLGKFARVTTIFLACLHLLISHLLPGSTQLCES